MFWKVSLTLSLLIFLGVGCTENKTVETDFFEKKRICISYKEKIEEQYTIVDEGVFSNVIKIFYSPVRNSCLFATYESYSQLGSAFYIYDYMTKESVYTSSDKVLFDEMVSSLENN